MKQNFQKVQFFKMASNGSHFEIYYKYLHFQCYVKSEKIHTCINYPIIRLKHAMQIFINNLKSLLKIPYL